MRTWYIRHKRKLKPYWRHPCKPQNVRELCLFLGLLNYYAKFIPNLLLNLHPLYDLLQANCWWRWSSDCDKAFQEAKQILVSAPILAHYDPQLPIYAWLVKHQHTELDWSFHILCQMAWSVLCVQDTHTSRATVCASGEGSSFSYFRIL